MSAGTLPLPPRQEGGSREAADTRRIRLDAILRGSCELPDLLFGLLGTEAMAEAFDLPPSAIERIRQARPGVRRRFAKRLRARFGLRLDQIKAARTVPDDAAEVTRAAYFFAVAIRLAGTRRVLSREDRHGLNERYGADAVGFALQSRATLTPHLEVLDEYRTEDPPTEADLRLFVRSLAAHGHPGAAAVALKLSLPVALATAKVINLDLALETGLPEVAAAAVASVVARQAPSGAPGEPDGEAHDVIAPDPEDPAGDANLPAPPDSPAAA